MTARGEVWWADLGYPRGSAPAFRRPALVMSSDAYNRSGIRSLIAVTLSSDLRLADAPGNVALPRGAAGLSKDSVVNVSQIVTLAKEDLEERIGGLDLAHLRLVEDGLRRVLALDPA